MQFQARCRIHIIRRQCLAFLIVEEHDARPVLLLIFALRLAEKLCRLRWHLIVFDNLDGVGVIAKPPQRGQIIQHQHVAILEKGPPLKITQIGG